MPAPEQPAADPMAVESEPPQDAAAGRQAVKVTLRRIVGPVGVAGTARTLLAMNQPGGFDCPGCAWPEAPPGERQHLELCENGAKAVAEEATRERADPAFFARWSIDELATWSDHQLGSSGRLTTPMIRRDGSTHYEPLSWDAALAEIAATLRSLDHPDRAAFYTSGRTSNEAAFLYQLLVRSYGTNNLPDCSNMCHEASGVALGDAIGIGKGTVTLADFDSADVICVVGQNPGTNHPRMLTTLEAAARRGATIIAVNPLPEAGLLRFRNPQTARGLIGRGTRLASIHLPIALGGDRALFQLWNRWMVERDQTRPGTLDRAFIDAHTSGFDELARHLADVDEQTLLSDTGLREGLVREAFEHIAGAERLIICWAMGITQHVGAVPTIREIANLALLGGHIGRPGAGLCPVRGHSNVQGDRTMGIWERPKPAFLDALEAATGLEMPRVDGLDSVDTVRAMADGEVDVLIGMGGNLVRAVSDTEVAERAMRRARLTVQISTKLNRSHIVGGRTAIILPTLGRTELDPGGSFVTVEDSMGMVHATRGVLTPVSPHLRSEVAIVCDLAEALFGPEHAVPWTELRNDLPRVRGLVEAVVPGFDRFDERSARPGGFALPNAPRDERRFETPDGRAHFAVTHVEHRPLPAGRLILQTLRSHDQYNTTIYGFDDRYRGLSGDRRVVMVNHDDLTDLGLADGDRVDIVSELPDGERRAADYRVVAYPTPRGSAAAYYPETNVLIGLDHRSPEAGTPASKAVPIRLERRDAG